MAENYGPDLAYIHDAGFADFARRAAPYLLELVSQHAGVGAVVYDLGCGTGIWTQVLVEAGYSAVGVDISRDMLRIARKRAPAARFIEGSFFEIELEQCAAVTSLGECFNYAFDPVSSRKALEELLGKIYEALKPGGILAFDILLPEYLKRVDSRSRRYEGKDWQVIVRLEADPRTQRVYRHITSTRDVDGEVRTNTEVHPVQLYAGEALEEVLHQLGFDVCVLDSYGDLELGCGHAAFVAEK